LWFASSTTSGKRCAHNANAVSIFERGTLSTSGVRSERSAIAPTAVRGSCMTVTGISIGVNDLIASSFDVHIAPLPLGWSAST
jgi:hypothetical protein